MTIQIEGSALSLSKSASRPNIPASDIKVNITKGFHHSHFSKGDSVFDLGFGGTAILNGIVEGQCDHTHVHKKDLSSPHLIDLGAAELSFRRSGMAHPGGGFVIAG